MEDSTQLVESVAGLALTEEGDELLSNEASGENSLPKSFDEVAEGVGKMDINHPLFVQV